MRILLIHPNTLTDYHLERIVKESLESLNHTVVAIKYRGEPSEWVSAQLSKESEQCDFALILKGETLTEENFAKIKCVKALWYVDHPKDDVLTDWLLRGVTNVDFVFVSSYGLIEKLQPYNSKCYWIVEGAHLPLLQPVEEEKQYDLSFFGTLIAETNNGDVFGSRFEWLKQVNEKYEVHLFGGDSSRKMEGFQFANHHPPVWNENLAREIAKSKIVLGYNSTNKVELYWSNRTYTTLACKGFLLTPYVPGLERVFENHKELVWFHSDEEYLRYIEYYLANPLQRERIAEAGYRKVVALFSTKHQIQKLTKIVSEKSLRLGKKPTIALITDAGYVGCKGASLQWRALLEKEGFNVRELYLEEEGKKELVEQYEMLIFNGYSGKYEPLLESSSKKFFVWHSSLLQTQLEKEIPQIRKIKEHQSAGKINGVLCTDRNCLKFFENAKLLPNVYVVAPSFSNKKLVEEGKVNVSALGPGKERKNLFTALQAISHLSDGYRIHINVSEEFYNKNIKGLFDESKIVNHGWLNREDYFTLIKQCDVGVQISVGESYNFVAADHLICGTPIICSSSIISIPSTELHMKNLEDSGELIAKIDEVRRSKNKKKWQEEFEKQNQRHIRKVLTFFKQQTQIPYSVPAININTKRPILSIVFHGRNDNYAGDFKRRLCWSLSTIQKSFGELKPEIIFVCWNTLPFAQKIFDDPLFKDCRSGIKLYEVSDKIHQDLAKKFNYPGVYLEWFAKNFGVRRAEGEYILQLNSDNMVANPVSINDLPMKDQSFVATRTEVRDEILRTHPNEITVELLESIRRGEWIPDIERPHYVGGSCGEFILAHRNIWNEICGNVEVADRYCIDNVTATHLREVSELSLFKHKAYHISHQSASGTWPGFDFPIGYSGPNWGLSEVYVEPYYYE